MTIATDMEIAWYRARAVARALEELRVAKHRAMDRRLLAENAWAAGQDAFARLLEDAADAHEAIAREIAARLRDLERPPGPGGAAAARATVAG